MTQEEAVYYMFVLFVSRGLRESRQLVQWQLK
jgi:hypothetical protein